MAHNHNGVAQNMGMLNIECHICGRFFCCARGSMAYKTKLCGDCVKITCPNSTCGREIRLDQIKELEGLRCSWCGADLEPALEKMRA